MSHRASRLCGSSPAVGSSRNSTAGRWKIARATISRWAMPPDSAYTDAFAHFERLQLLEQLVGDPTRLRRGDPEQAPVEVEVLPYRQLAVERVLLGDDPDQLLGERGLGDDVDRCPRRPNPTSGSRAW